MMRTPHSPNARHLLAVCAALGAAPGAASADGVPPLEYQTYLSGYDLGYGTDVVVDAGGDAFVLAASYGDNTKNDIVLAKLDPAGNVLWQRYLRGSDIDVAGGIALDPNGDLWVTGWTDSDDFPITGDALDKTLTGFRDVFVTKIASADGAVLYSTYIGGDYADGGNDIAVGDDGRVYVTGFSISKDYPTTDDAIQPMRANGYSYAYSDEILTILSPDGRSILYSTYFGGSDDDEAGAIALDADGSIIVGGWSHSPDFPTEHPFQAENAGGDRDLVVTRFTPGGTGVGFSTYLGGEDLDKMGRVAIGPDGAVFVAGSTRSITFPTTPSAFQPDFDGAINGCEIPFGERYNCEDMFVAKLTPDGAGLDYSTYLGGGLPDEARAVAVDRQGRAHIVGYSYSSDFPGSDDQYTVLVAELSADGSALGYTFSTSSSYANAGHGIAVGPGGGVYLTGAIHFPADIYIAKLGADCVADFNADGNVDTQDVLAFLNAWNAGDRSADVNGDGGVDTQDVLTFLNLWNAGC